VSLSKAMNDALDAHPGGDATIEADADSGSAAVEVTDVGKIGVRIKRVRIEKTTPTALEEAAVSIPKGLRSLGEPLNPVEVAPSLGGARFRTSPEEIHEGEYFELEIHQSGKSELSRTRVDNDGNREDVDWAMTRDNLGRLLDELTD
jgi:hypothetical protein